MELTAQERWGKLSADRVSFIGRCEAYSQYTLPKICLPQGYTQDKDELSNDYQSLGAQLANNLSNKMMLALFAPSRPFFRTEVPVAVLQEQGATEQLPEVQKKLSRVEQQAVKVMDSKALRPKFYEVLKHLIITGNVLAILGKDTCRVVGIKNYVVKRDRAGKVLEVVHREDIYLSQYGDKEQKELSQWYADLEEDTTTEAYTWVKWNRTTKRYDITYWCDEHQFTETGWESEKGLSYRAMTWDLADNDDYGTGLVEEYANDFAALSVLSEAQVNAAILASEFRWLVNPAGQTSAQDFNNAANGAALPGAKDDVSPVAFQAGSNVAAIQALSSEYVNRLGRGFLMAASVTRDAERVTAAEIRLQAMELETGLGGAYSRIAVDVQLPVAKWLLGFVADKALVAELDLVVITGLDALSRSGDMENLKLFVQDMAELAVLPPTLLVRLKLSALSASFAAGRGIDADTYVYNEEDAAKREAQAQAQQVAVQGAVDTNAAQAQASAAAQQGSA